MSGEQTVIYSAGSLQEAYLVRDALAAQDIAAMVLNEALQGAIGELPPGLSTSPKVTVASSQAAQARELMESIQHQFAPRRTDPLATAGTQSVGGETSTGQPVADHQVDWPHCPQCEALRQTVCPICHVAGTDFPAAEYTLASMVLENDCDPDNLDIEQTALDDASWLLVCHNCDEAFQPEFYRKCPWCGHDFGQGMELSPPGEPTSDREVAVIIGLGLLAVAAVMYLWLLFG